MRYNGVFGCHGNTCYVILIGSCFCPINVCTDFEINRYKIDQFIKHAKIVFYMTHMTQKNGGGANASDMHFDQEHFETTIYGSKVMARY